MKDEPTALIAMRTCPSGSSLVATAPNYEDTPLGDMVELIEYVDGLVALCHENATLRAELDRYRNSRPYAERIAGDGDAVWWHCGGAYYEPFMGSPEAADWPFDELDVTEGALRWTTLAKPYPVETQPTLGGVVEPDQ